MYMYVMIPFVHVLSLYLWFCYYMYMYKSLTTFNRLDHFFKVSTVTCTCTCIWDSPWCQQEVWHMYVIGCVLWRVLTGRNKKITRSFVYMYVRHTGCIVDGNFSLIKWLYCHSDFDAVSRFSGISLQLSFNKHSSTLLMEVQRMKCCAWETLKGGQISFSTLFYQRIMGGKVTIRVCGMGKRKLYKKRSINQSTHLPGYISTWNHPRKSGILTLSTSGLNTETLLAPPLLNKLRQDNIHVHDCTCTLVVVHVLSTFDFNTANLNVCFLKTFISIRVK